MPTSLWSKRGGHADPFDRIVVRNGRKRERRSERDDVYTALEKEKKRGRGYHSVSSGTSSKHNRQRRRGEKKEPVISCLSLRWLGKERGGKRSRAHLFKKEEGGLRRSHGFSPQKRGGNKKGKKRDLVPSQQIPTAEWFARQIRERWKRGRKRSGPTDLCFFHPKKGKGGGGEYRLRSFEMYQEGEKGEKRGMSNVSAFLRLGQRGKRKRKRRRA